MPKTKTVFQTDHDGVYLYPVQANELALVPDLFNIPFGAYEDEPPPAPAGMVARRAQGAWALAEDHRNVPLWLVHTGESYTPGASVELEGLPVHYRGIGPIPEWLTADAAAVRPGVES